MSELTVSPNLSGLRKNKIRNGPADSVTRCRPVPQEAVQPGITSSGLGGIFPLIGVDRDCPSGACDLALVIGEQRLGDDIDALPDRPFFIEKLPYNFRYIGLIHLGPKSLRVPCGYNWGALNT